MAPVMSVRLKLVLGAAMVVLIHLLVLIVFGDNGLVELSTLRSREALLIQQNEIIESENVRLYRIIRRLKNDPVYIESVARNELGMVGKDDLVMLRPAAQRQGNRDAP
jgi:cell division protein FtsB